MHNLHVSVVKYYTSITRFSIISRCRVIWSRKQSGFFTYPVR